MAIIDFFDRGWDMNGQAIAYIQGERSFTFDEVGQRSCQIANTLLGLGLPKETKGAVWSGNDVAAWTCTLGLWRANMTWIPVNPRNAADDNRYLLDAFDCEVLFFQHAFSETIAALRPTLPKIKHWICIDADLPDALGLDQWCAAQPATKPAIVAGLDDVFVIMPTGGTTGAPTQLVRHGLDVVAIGVDADPRSRTTRTDGKDFQAGEVGFLDRSRREIAIGADIGQLCAAQVPFQFA